MNNWMRACVLLILAGQVSLFGLQRTNNAAVQSDQNQKFPDKIFFRSTTDSFNRKYYFLLSNGRVYIKKHDNFKDNLSGWIPIGDNDHDKTIQFDRIEQISVDGSQLELVYNNKIYTCNQGLDDHKKWTWNGNWGHPFNLGPGLWLPAKYRAWSVSFSDPKEHKYQTDGNGNKFYTFVGSIYLLSDDGTVIHLADPWTPADWGYQIGTPLRGRFVAKNISVSGSVVFLIGQNGDMYTRHINFDVIGANPILKYTYDKTPVYEGILNQGHPRKLPIADWTRQPKINGIITGKITVYSTGEGDLARALRVEGFDRHGNSGYFEKALMDTKWTFVITGQKIDRKKILSNTILDRSAKDLGPTREHNYTGMIGGHQAVLEDFNLYCSPAGMKIEIKPGIWVHFILHTVFKFRMFIQEDPGTEGSPLELQGVVEIPEALIEDPDKDIREFLKDYLAFTKGSGISRFIPIEARATLKEVYLEKSGIFSFFSTFKINFNR